MTKTLPQKHLTLSAITQKPKNIYNIKNNALINWEGYVGYQATEHKIICISNFKRIVEKISKLHDLSVDNYLSVLVDVAAPHTYNLNANVIVRMGTMMRHSFGLVDFMYGTRWIVKIPLVQPSTQFILKAYYSYTARSTSVRINLICECVPAILKGNNRALI